MGAGRVQNQCDLFLRQLASSSCVSAIRKTIGEDVAQIGGQGLDSLVECHTGALVVWVPVPASNYVSTPIKLRVEHHPYLHRPHGCG